MELEDIADMLEAMDARFIKQYDYSATHFMAQLEEVFHSTADECGVASGEEKKLCDTESELHHDESEPDEIGCELIHAESEHINTERRRPRR